MAPPRRVRWHNEHYLQFSNASLEDDFRARFHATGSHHDCVWSLLQVISSISEVLIRRRMKHAEPTSAAYTALVYFYLANWATPAVVCRFVGKDRWARLRTRFHVAHYFLFVGTMFWKARLLRDAAEPTLCLMAQSTVSEILFSVVVNTFGRQLLLKDALRLHALCFGLLCYLMLNGNGVCSTVGRCKWPLVLDIPYGLLKRVEMPGVFSFEAAVQQYENTFPHRLVGYMTMLVWSALSFLSFVSSYWVERKRRDAFLQSRGVRCQPFDEFVFALEVLQVVAILLCYALGLCCLVW